MAKTKFGGATPSPAVSGTASSANSDENESEVSPGAQFNQTLDEHSKKVHSHLKMAHAAAGNNPAVARHHINQAGIAAKALHKTAKESATANGNQDDSNEYSTQGDNYQGD